MDRTSGDLTQETLAALKGLLPQAFTEGKIDFARLREALGDELDDRPERYSFTWAGKRDAIRLLQTPSRATLVPSPKESVNFDSTNNVFIEGENLEVLKLLYKSYAGRVKMIYIDPPYNTGNDFIYPDNFTDPLDTYLRLTGQKDSDGNLLTSNPETSGRYHSAWLTMMYPRLFVARQLLAEDGIILVSIGDEELGNLLLLMNEVFGEENLAGIFVWKARAKPSNIPEAKFKPQRVAEYVVAYSKQPDGVPFSPLVTGDERTYPHHDAKGDYRLATILKSNRGGNVRETMRFTIAKYTPPATQRWQGGVKFITELHESGHIEFRDGVPFRKYYKHEEPPEHDPLYTFMSPESTGTSEIGKNQLNELVGNLHGFDTVKPLQLLDTFVTAMTSDEDIILDFFCGSGTSAHAIVDANRKDGQSRRFVLVQLPENITASSTETTTGFRTIADISKERIRRVIKKLKDEDKGKLELKDREAPEDLGFKVFTLAESNYQRWRGTDAKTGEALLAEMEKQADPLLPGWKPMNVIYEVALKEGYSLTCTVEEVKGAAGNTVYRVTDADKGQSFLICLDDKLKAPAIKALGLKKDDLFICRDVALTDEQAANLALQCKLKTI